MLFLNLTVDLFHLLDIQFACQHHHVGKLGIEFQCLDVGDVELGGKVNFNVLLAAIGHDSYVGGNHSSDVRLFSCIDNLSHRFQVFPVDDGIDGEIGLNVFLTTRCGNLFQVVDGEMIGRM